MYTAMIALLVALLVALGMWYFLSARRRLGVTSVLVPEPDAPVPASSSRGPDPAVVEGVATLPADTRSELLRSLERMEGDLGALRAELERMREQVRKASRGSEPPRR